MCVQWFQPELDCVSVGDPADTQSQRSRAVWFLYAFNNKGLDLTVNPASGQVKAGLCHVIESRAQAIHEKLMVTLETAENDLALTVQASQTAVGITEQSRGKFWHFLWNASFITRRLRWPISDRFRSRLCSCYLKQDFADEDPRTSRRFLKTIKRALDISDPMEIAGCLGHVCLPLKHNICVRAKWTMKPGLTSGVHIMNPLRVFLPFSQLVPNSH